MDPFMGSGFPQIIDSNKSGSLIHYINQYHQNDSFELVDLFEKYGNLFSDCEDNTFPDPPVTTSAGTAASRSHQQFAQSRVDFSPMDSQQQSELRPGRSGGVVTRASKNDNYKPPMPSVFLTPAPTPSPYFSNVSSPESSHKKSGRPERDIARAEKAFARRRKFMTKSQRQKESNNISSLKHRRKKNKKLNELLEQEKKLTERHTRLAERCERYERYNVTVKTWIMNLLPNIEDQTAVLTRLNNLNLM